MHHLFHRHSAAAPLGPSRRLPLRSLHLAPRESDHLLLHGVGRLVQYRLARGLRLNAVEAWALIGMQMTELIRNGRAATLSGGGDGNVVKRDGSITPLMSLGSSLLGRNQVMPHVPELVREVQVEATFLDGTKLLTIHDPLRREDRDLELGLEGSFLPVPDLSVFRSGDEGADLGRWFDRWGASVSR